MDLFPNGYYDSRTRFVKAAEALGAQLSSYPLNVDGHTELSVDVAHIGAPGLPTVVVSSGLHGVECSSGAAVQLAWMAARQKLHPHVRFVFLHSLNPYGFVHGRRVDECNVDINRNFIDIDEVASKQGTPLRSDYSRFDPLLNPPYPPTPVDGFFYQALKYLIREGKSDLQRSIVTGQYEFERGLFYGGSKPSATTCLLKDKMQAWIGDAPDVCHLDFHTGLGRFARCQLLVQSTPASAGWAWYVQAFGQSELVPTETTDSQAYQANGAMGNWLVNHFSDRPYRFLTAEFGTYSALKVLGALRKENQAYHFSPPGSRSSGLARQQLERCFCPPSARWRGAVVTRGVSLIEQAGIALAKWTNNTPE